MDITDLNEEGAKAFYIFEGEAWKMQSYCLEPTCTMVKVGDEDCRRNFGVGGLTALGFIRLVPKGDVK